MKEIGDCMNMMLSSIYITNTSFPEKYKPFNIVVCMQQTRLRLKRHVWYWRMYVAGARNCNRFHAVVLRPLASRNPYTKTSYTIRYCSSISQTLVLAIWTTYWSSANYCHVQAVVMEYSSDLARATFMLNISHKWVVRHHYFMIHWPVSAGSGYTASCWHCCQSNQTWNPNSLHILNEPNGINLELQ